MNDAKQTKSPSRSRAESMNLLRAATLELLKTVDPGDLTIREIAEHAGVFHRYVPDYFGGKAELLADVYPVMQEQAQLGLIPLVGNAIRPEVIRLAHLAVWLSVNRDGGVPTGERTLTAQLVITLTEQVGLDEPTATLIAQRVMAGVIVLTAFPDIISDEPIDIAAHRRLEQRIFRLLARDADECF